MKRILNSVEDTKRFSNEIVTILKEKYVYKNNATVLVLSGDLGVGKTTLSQAIGEIFDVSENISSPTFVLMKKYKILNNQPWLNFIHIDAYRSDNIGDVSILKLPEVFLDKKNFVVIEWGEKIKEILPKDYFLVSFSHKDNNTREVNFDFDVQ